MQTYKHELSAMTYIVRSHVNSLVFIHFIVYTYFLLPCINGGYVQLHRIEKQELQVSRHTRLHARARTHTHIYKMVNKGYLVLLAHVFDCPRNRLHRPIINHQWYFWNDRQRAQRRHKCKNNQIIKNNYHYYSLKLSKLNRNNNAF